MPIGHCKLKQLLDTNRYLLEQVKSLTKPNAGEDVEQWELSLLREMQNGTAALEDSLAVLHRIVSLTLYVFVETHRTVQHWVNHNANNSRL